MKRKKPKFNNRIMGSTQSLGFWVLANRRIHVAQSRQGLANLLLAEWRRPLRVRGPRPTGRAGDVRRFLRLRTRGQLPLRHAFEEVRSASLLLVDPHRHLVEPVAIDGIALEEVRERVGVIQRRLVSPLATRDE